MAVFELAGLENETRARCFINIDSMETGEKTRDEQHAEHQGICGLSMIDR